MSKNLEARLAKLEQLSGGEIHNGGLLIAWMREGESRDDALGRALRQDWVRALTPGRRRQINPVFLESADAEA